MMIQEGKKEEEQRWERGGVRHVEKPSYTGQRERPPCVNECVSRFLKGIFAVRHNSEGLDDCLC